jgi:hypothetical protein
MIICKKILFYIFKIKNRIFRQTQKMLIIQSAMPRLYTEILLRKNYLKKNLFLL